MKKASDTQDLIPEPRPLLKERRGGALNLILAAQVLEAARMAEEGHGIPEIEAAAKKAFGQPRGFLRWMDEVGIFRVVAVLEALSDDSDPEDPMFRTYHNFFSPPETLRKKQEAHGADPGAPGARWIPETGDLPEPQDIMRVDLLAGRFRAVAFMTAVDIVEAGIVHLQDLDRHCREAFGWKEGPFALMNRLGIREALRLVVEKMELSHRKEINFPIPRLLIAQAQKNEPWPLNSGIP